MAIYPIRPISLTCSMRRMGQMGRMGQLLIDKEKLIRIWWGIAIVEPWNFQFRSN